MAETTAEDKAALAAQGEGEPSFMKLNNKEKMQHVLEHAGFQKKQPSIKSLETSSWYFIKHVGFNNIEASTLVPHIVLCRHIISQ